MRFYRRCWSTERPWGVTTTCVLDFRFATPSARSGGRRLRPSTPARCLDCAGEVRESASRWRGDSPLPRDGLSCSRLSSWYSTGRRRRRADHDRWIERVHAAVKREGRAGAGRARGRPASKGATRQGHVPMLRLGLVDVSLAEAFGGSCSTDDGPAPAGGAARGTRQVHATLLRLVDSTAWPRRRSRWYGGAATTGPGVTACTWHWHAACRTAPTSTRCARAAAPHVMPKTRSTSFPTATGRFPDPQPNPGVHGAPARR